MSKKPMWTSDEIREFDRLADETGSRHPMTRLDARLNMGLFVKKHGKAKCDAMWAHLEGGGEIDDGPLVDVED